MGLSKTNGTRFAFVSVRSSAFCDEIVEVYPGEVDGDQGNRLCRIATGECDAWIRVDWLEPPPRPIASPFPKEETRRIYHAMLGRSAPMKAPAGLMWATVKRYLVKAEWEEFEAWWLALHLRPARRRVLRPKRKRALREERSSSAGPGLGGRVYPII